MVIKITGNVYGGGKQITGIVDLPNEEALRLINLGVAVAVDENDIIPLMEGSGFVDHAKKVMADQSKTIDGQVEEIRILNDQVKSLTVKIELLSTENVNLRTHSKALEDEIAKINEKKKK